MYFLSSLDLGVNMCQTVPKDKHQRKIVLHSLDFQHPYTSQGQALVLWGGIHGSRQLAWTEMGSGAVPVPQLQTRKLTLRG